MWFRVFGTNDIQPEPAQLLEHLHGLGVDVPCDFGGDAHGWFRADFTYEEKAPPLHLERFLAEDDDIRDDLNACAAWLETVESHAVVPRLLECITAADVDAATIGDAGACVPTPGGVTASVLALRDQAVGPFPSRVPRWEPAYLAALRRIGLDLQSWKEPSAHVAHAIPEPAVL